MVRAAAVDAGIDLSAFSARLGRCGIEHRIFEERGRQVICVDSPREAEFVRRELPRWSAGEGAARGAKAAWTGRAPVRRLLRRVGTSPVTWTLMLACLAAAGAGRLGLDLQGLFYPPLPSGGLGPLLAGVDGAGTLARTLTPALLHFGAAHLAFNLLWLGFLGLRLEAALPRWLYPPLPLLAAFAGNTAQYLHGGRADFGGMSGVVYGLAGCAWALDRLAPGGRPLMPGAMFAFFLAALAAMEVFASSWIATAAHVGGLLSGLAFGGAAAAWLRLAPRRPSAGRGRAA